MNIFVYLMCCGKKVSINVYMSEGISWDQFVDSEPAGNIYTLILTTTKSSEYVGDFWCRVQEFCPILDAGTESEDYLTGLVHKFQESSRREQGDSLNLYISVAILGGYCSIDIDTGYYWNYVESLLPECYNMDRSVFISVLEIKSDSRKVREYWNRLKLHCETIKDNSENLKYLLSRIIDCNDFMIRHGFYSQDVSFLDHHAIELKKRLEREK